MASIYDKASLVLIPSGTKTSKVYSQVPTNGDGDFTFSRSTAATRVNASGNIEKETQNLLLHSNQFDTTWTFGGVTRTSGQSGYDGSNDAWLITATNTSGANVNQVVNASAVKTYSLYAKAGTTNWIRMSFDDTGINSRAWFDLTNGVVGAIFGNVIDTEITSVGSGWYRCSISVNLSVNSPNLYMFVVNGNGVNSAAVGDSVYIQDAQLEQGLVARDYIETTTTAIYGGITDNVPRLDYTDSSCPALLLEPSRTNLIPYSEYLTNNNSFSSINATQESGFYQSPEGLENAYKWTTTTANSNAFIDLGRFNTTNGSVYTFSFYLKSDVSDVNVRCAFTRGTTEQITADLTTEWKRFEITFTADDTSKDFLILFGDYGITNPAQTIFVYGIMQEEGSYPTSYIPTYGVSQTRLADSALTTTGVESLITSQNGTMFAHIKPSEIDGSFQFSLSDGSTSNRFTIRRLSSNTEFIVVIGGSVQIRISVTNQPLITDFKFAATWTSGYSAFFINGVKIGDDQQFTLGGTMSRLGFDTGYNTSGSYGLVQKALLFPTALSDSECITLTTI